MTPDVVVSLHGIALAGSWGGRAIAGAGSLVVHRAEGHLATRDVRLAIAWRHLSDATLERGELALHQGTDRLTIAGGADGGEVPRVWAHVVAQACPTPEFTRGLKALGRRGGDPEWQVRFFGPLLAARRRAGEPDAVERRVAHFDAAALGTRWTAELTRLAAARHPTDAPRRRALEAVLEEAMEPCLSALDTLHGAALRVHEAPVGTRFVAWRRWTGALRRVFIEADRAWHQVSQHLP